MDGIARGRNGDPADDLLNEVWGYESYPSSPTVDNHVAGLRAKLECDSSQPEAE